MGDAIEAQASDVRSSPEVRFPLKLVGGRLIPDRRGKPPSTKGVRSSWAGGWGILADRRSRLSKLAERLERSLRLEHLVTRPLWKARIRQAARYMALAEAMLDRVGVEPGATPARASKLQRTADHLVKTVPKRPARARSEDLGAALARARPNHGA